MTKETANQLALIEKNLTDEQIIEKAGKLVKSGFLPKAIDTAEKALMVALTGRELGIGMMEALRSINIIQGRPAMAAQLMLALAQRTGELEDMKVEEKPGVCTTTITRKGKSPHVYSFSMDDAKALGLTSKDNWLKQPKTMLRWRSLSGNLRVTFADAICGLYTEDEAEDIIADKVEAQEILEETSQIKKDEIIESAQGAEGLTNPLEVDQLGMTYLKPPFDKAYTDRTIMEIYRDKLPSGDPRGKKYLQTVIEKTKDAQERATVEAFISLMEAF